MSTYRSRNSSLVYAPDNEWQLHFVFFNPLHAFFYILLLMRILAASIFCPSEWILTKLVYKHCCDLFLDHKKFDFVIIQILHADRSTEEQYQK